MAIFGRLSRQRNSLSVKITRCRRIETCPLSNQFLCQRMFYLSEVYKYDSFWQSGRWYGANLVNLSDDCFIHTKLHGVIFDKRSEEFCDMPENGFIEVLKREKEFISLVHPGLQ